MDRGRYKNCSAVLVFAVVLTVSSFGCYSTDLTGYRPASEHATSRVSNQSEKLSKTTPIEQVASNTDHATSSDQGEKLSSDSNVVSPTSALFPVNTVDGTNVKALMSVPAGNPQVTSGSGQTVPADPASDAAEPRKIELLVKDKTFRTEPKTGALRVSFDDLDLLKVLNMEPVVENAKELMPDWLRGLDGKTIRLRGFMFPTNEAEGIERFVFARDNQICCFGRDPKVYDLVQVDMKPGKTTNYIPATRAFDVVGTLRIDMQMYEGKPFGLYLIENADVIDR